MDISNTDVSNNNLELALESPNPSYEGRMTKEGLYINDASYTFIPRAKAQPRHNLTEEDEMEIEKIVKALKRDFPDTDYAVLEMIATWHHEDPEAFEKKVDEMKKRDSRPREEIAKDLFSKKEFGVIEDEYERVY
tara:strand:+ start:1599 stop:2003 length:405 start_codon:yes stop_codon:yes gene_type:complete